MTTQPFISVITVTCGRTRWLESAMHGFLHQSYTGPCEHIILNTFPEQTLRLNADSLNLGNRMLGTVNVINLPARPESLGLARNIAIGEAAGDVIVTLDDDDYILPHHLSEVAKHFTDPGNDWIWMEKEFWGWGNTIKEIVPGACPAFMFTKKAWNAVGGYPSLTVGEDRDFISCITQKFPGKRVAVEPYPSFVYGWNNGVYHTCGQGDDAKGKVPAHQRFWEDLQRRVKRGHEPVGEIQLQPKCATDWPKLAREFVSTQDLKKKT